jgi:hypothetical protein
MARRGRGRGRGRVGGARTGAGRGRGRGSLAAPRTEGQIKAAGNAAAGAEFNPEIREGREQAKGSRQRQADLGSWYAQLAADYQGAQNAGAAALRSAEATTTQQLAEAAGQSATDQAGLSAEDAKISALIGGPGDTAGLSKIARAGIAAATARAGQAAPGLSEQADFVARLGADKAASRLGGIRARQDEQARRDKIIGGIGAARREKGAARVADTEKIRESERAYQAELAKMRLARREAKSAEESAAAESALAQLKASREARQDAIANRQAQERIGVSRSNAKISAKNARTSAASAKTSARAQRATARHYEKENAGGLTTAEKRARGEHASDAMSAAKALLGIKVPKNAKQWSQFEVALVEKIGSSYAAEAARAVATLRRRQNAQRRGAFERRTRRAASSRSDVNGSSIGR